MPRSPDPPRVAPGVVVRQLEATPERTWFRNTALAVVFAGLGDTTRTLDALERAERNHEFWASYNRVADPMYDIVRKSARWAALVKRAGVDGTPGALK